MRKTNAEEKGNSLSQRVLSYIQRHDLIAAHEPLVVGVSGGPDSLCLLYLLAELRKHLDFTLQVAHFNHGLRGEEAEADAVYVVDQAHRLGLPVSVERGEVRALRAQYRCSLEEAAREARYAFLGQVGRAVGASRVAVGHTADDQVETVLLHLIRGAGVGGLAGMEPKAWWHSAFSKEQVLVIRPLLEVTHEETEAFCAARGLGPRRDLSNLWPSLLRNRVRAELLPLLEKYNPQIKAALLRLAEAARVDRAFLEAEGQKVWHGLVQEEEGYLLVERPALAALPPALQRHLLRRCLQQLRGNLVDIEAQHIEAMLDILKKPPGSQLSLPKGLAFSRGYQSCYLGPSNKEPCPFPPLVGEQPLTIPGETDFSGWKIKASLGSPPGPRPASDRWQAHLDAGAAGKQLWVRARRPGDVFYPLGMSEPKRLQDFMVDAKIPRGWRERIPLVVSPQHLVWVVGWRLDDRAKVTEATPEVLTLEFSQSQAP